MITVSSQSCCAIPSSTKSKMTSVNDILIGEISFLLFYTFILADVLMVVCVLELAGCPPLFAKEILVVCWNGIFNGIIRLFLCTQPTVPKLKAHRSSVSLRPDSGRQVVSPNVIKIITQIATTFCRACSYPSSHKSHKALRPQPNYTAWRCLDVNNLPKVKVLVLKAF